MEFKICKNRIHIFPFPDDCPSIEHADCDESFTKALQNQDTAIGILNTFARCPFCFPEN